MTKTSSEQVVGYPKGGLSRMLSLGGWRHSAFAAYKLSGPVGAFSLVFAVALLIGCYQASSSGALWPDGPQYANAAAMIHDWLLSGEWLHPYRFAERQYARFPAFHLPFHPPAYPALLGVFFIFTGVSYLSARVFVALCLGVAGWLFAMTLRRLGTGWAGAVAGALLLMTTPEVAGWARDTMSEIPALAFVCAGTYFFVGWLETRRATDCVLALVCAEVAFLSRLTAIGVLPVWVLFALFTGKWRRLLAPLPLACSVMMLTANVLWVMFIRQYAKYETGAVAGAAHAATAGAHAARFLWEPLDFYFKNMPRMAGWSLPVVALGALCYFLMGRRRDDATPRLGAAWFIGFAGLLFALGLSPERRYFVFVLPSFALFVAALFKRDAPLLLRRYAAPALAALCLAFNVWGITRLPHGLVGYDAVAGWLARSDERGNIMLASRQSQDLIFRYQTYRQPVKRSFVRVDRTLAIRVTTAHGGFARGSFATVILAENADDVRDILRRGRVRFLVTYTPVDQNPDSQTEEMKLAHAVATSRPDLFQFVERFPLTEHLDVEPELGHVHLWRFLEPLPEGDSELPVIVPTADMTIRTN